MLGHFERRRKLNLPPYRNTNLPTCLSTWYRWFLERVRARHPHARHPHVATPRHHPRARHTPRHHPRGRYPRARHPRARHLRLSMTPLHLRHFSQDELKRDHDLTEHVQGLEQGAAARRASERKQSLLQHRKMLQERWLQDEQEEQELQAQRPPWRGRSARQRLPQHPNPNTQTLTPRP